MKRHECICTCLNCVRLQLREWKSSNRISASCGKAPITSRDTWEPGLHPSNGLVDNYFRVCWHNDCHCGFRILEVLDRHCNPGVCVRVKHRTVFDFTRPIIQKNASSIHVIRNDNCVGLPSDTITTIPFIIRRRCASEIEIYTVAITRLRSRAQNIIGDQKAAVVLQSSFEIECIVLISLWRCKRCYDIRSRAGEAATWKTHATVPWCVDFHERPLILPRRRCYNSDRSVIIPSRTWSTCTCPCTGFE